MLFETTGLPNRQNFRLVGEFCRFGSPVVSKGIGTIGLTQPLVDSQTVKIPSHPKIAAKPLFYRVLGKK
eukprot:5615129-Amphidinium_carterae.1